MFEKVNFQGKQWQVVGKAKINLVDNPSSLKDNYGCDMVIKNNQHFFMLNEIIDAEFEEIEEEWELKK